MSNSTEEEPRKKRLLSDTDGEESNAESVKKFKQGESLPQEATRIDDNQNSNPNIKSPRLRLPDEYPT